METIGVPIPPGGGDGVGYLKYLINIGNILPVDIVQSTIEQYVHSSRLQALSQAHEPRNRSVSQCEQKRLGI